LAQTLGLKQPSISNWKRQGRIEINSFEKVFSLLNLKRNELIKNTKFIGISNAKIRNKKSIKFILSLYDLNNKEYKVLLKGKRRKLSIQSRTYLVLNAIVQAEKKGEISTRKLRAYNGYSHIGAQQWLQKLRKRELIKVMDKTYHNTGKIYSLTRKGRDLCKKLDDMYKIVNTIY